MKNLFNTFLFNPLYNALVFLTAIMPGNSVGLAIIFLTILVKILIFPLYHHSTKTQKKMKEIDPELKKIKKDYIDKQEQAKKIMELYKTHGLNPFSGIFVLFIQLPIILALFYVFYRGFELNLDVLYSFNKIPDNINYIFLGFINITEKSFWIGLLVGLSQFFQMRFSLPPTPKGDKPFGQGSLKEDMAKSMNMQMRYVMPFIFIFFASKLPAAVGLYWITSNLFSIGHELLIKRRALDILKRKAC
jgi:YidC/Oxa1 family membrane protein insertase